jgi:hypothetical protein
LRLTQQKKRQRTLRPIFLTVHPGLHWPWQSLPASLTACAFSVGSGAVGNCFGGWLFEAGRNVTFLEDALGIVSKSELRLRLGQHALVRLVKEVRHGSAGGGVESLPHGFSDERGIPEKSGTICDLKLPLYK